MKINTKILDMIISEEPLTKESLIKNNIEPNVIAKLIMRKKLSLNNDGTYTLTDIKELLNYGIIQLESNIVKAKKCFEICYKLAPNNSKVCLQYLLFKIETRNYQEAFEVFEKLDKINPERNIKHNNLYLFLLSNITKCPTEYIERLNNISVEDIIIDNKKNDSENKIRKAILLGEYEEAMKLLLNIIKEKSHYIVSYELIKALLREAINQEKNFNEANLIEDTENIDYHKATLEARKWADWIVNSMQMTIEEGIKNMGILPNFASIIRLVVAKDFYSWGNIEKGDYYLKRVELTNNISGIAILLFDELKQNRSLYQQQSNYENNKTLILKK